jgi:hypothetical protein
MLGTSAISWATVSGGELADLRRRPTEAGQLKRPTGYAPVYPTE